MRRTTSLFMHFLVTAVTAHSATAQLTTGPSLTVTTQWLAQHQKDKDLVILSVGPEGGYKKEHIAGSRYVQLNDIATKIPGGLSLEMPPESDLRGAFEKLGISDQSRIVVVFDSGWVTPSSRLFLTLGYAGLGDRALFLDGGLTGWRKAGLPLTADTVAAVPGHLTTKLLPAVIVDNAFVAAHASTPHAKLLDARAPEAYARPTATAQESAGHIPGAMNLPWGTLFDQDTDKLLDRAELEKKFSAVGVQPGDTVIGYCHVGQYATAMLLAARFLGHPVRLYDGSFQDWSKRKLPTVGGQ